MSAYERKWRDRWRVILTYGTYGALFAGGALVISDLVGPVVARDLGTAGGQGFGEGMIRAQAALESLSTSARGRRFL